MELPALTARCALAFVFIFAGASKLRSRGFTRSVEAMALVPRRAATMISRWLPRTELVLGSLLLVGIGLRIVIPLTGLLLLMFTTSIITSLLRKRQVDCGCFGGSSRPATWLTVLRNAVLLALVILIFLVPQPELGLATSPASRQIGYVDALIVLANTAGVIIVFALAGESSAARQKLDEIKRVLGAAP